MSPVLQNVQQREPKTGRPRDAPKDGIRGNTVKKWFIQNPSLKDWLDRESAEAVTDGLQGYGYCTFPGKCGESCFQLTLPSIRKHELSAEHQAHVKAIADTAVGEHELGIEANVFIETAEQDAGKDGNAPTLSESLSSMRRYGASFYVASGQVPETLNTVINDIVRAIEACWPRFDHLDESLPL